MNLMIIHYHLNPGGVTQIIKAQIRGIKSAWDNADSLIICGNSDDAKTICGTRVYADKILEYSNRQEDIGQMKGNLTQILSYLRGFIRHNTILHFHNPNLGKNPALTCAAYTLASEGLPVINHAHDFPEDRPDNLSLLKETLPQLSGADWHNVLYPDFPKYHFLVLNSCDHLRVLKQGIPQQRIHLMPNPVNMPDAEGLTGMQALRHRIFSALGMDENKMLCTYPVRAIRRKNPGEFLLMAAIFSNVSNFAITQAPRNPLEIHQYERWKDFCGKIGLRVNFEAGEKVSYQELIRISDFCITTSIREGFGMVYLEPWLAETPVIGRELPCITDDLSAMGVEFNRLYKAIVVRSHGGKSDFKDLEPEEQEQFIESVHKIQAKKLELLEDNPFLSALLDNYSEEAVLRNKQVIQQSFSIAEYGKRLLEIYREVSA